MPNEQPRKTRGSERHLTPCTMNGRQTAKENMATLFNRYVWLVDTIHRRGRITFEELNRRWQCSALNPAGEELPRRTFHNHRQAIEQMFDIDIACDTRNGYTYYIENDCALGCGDGGVRAWLLEAFAVNNLLSESRGLRGRVQVESIPSGQKFLTPLMDAMRENAVVEVGYHPYWTDPFTTVLEPYFLKLFHRRWYLIAWNDHVGQMRTYALDRIESLETTGKRFTYPSDFNAEGYFADCFGIDRQGEAERVVLRVSAAQARFLRALPLHASQCEEECTDRYVIFSYRLCPDSYDFQQHLLSLMGEVEVLAPVRLRTVIRERLEAMVALYW